MPVHSEYDLALKARQEQLSALAETLSKLLPAWAPITPEMVEAREGILTDLFNPCALLDYHKVHAALDFDRILSIKSWSINLDERFTDFAARSAMEETIKGGWFQKETKMPGVWTAFYDWERRHPSSSVCHGTSVRRTKVGTTRVNSTQANGKIIHDILAYRARFPADLKHFTAFAGRYIRKLQPNRPVTIVPSEAFDGEDRPKEQLTISWNGHDCVHAAVYKRDEGPGTLRWTDADLLVWGNI